MSKKELTPTEVPVLERKKGLLRMMELLDPEGEDMDGLTWDKIKEVVAYYERGNSDET